MTARLWYPQLDVFDTVRRIAILLQHFNKPPGTERLFIVDFFLANPPLLHRTTMTMEMRKTFSELHIPKPEKTFLSYPSAPLLFHKMESIQKEALNALLSRGLISHNSLQNGHVELTPRAEILFPVLEMCTEEEKLLSSFLTRHFAELEEAGNATLRIRTGLRRPI